jgi:hypothetical protein
MKDLTEEINVGVQCTLYQGILNGGCTAHMDVKYTNYN